MLLIQPRFWRGIACFGVARQVRNRKFCTFGITVKRKKIQKKENFASRCRLLQVGKKKKKLTTPLELRSKLEGLMSL